MKLINLTLTPDGTEDGAVVEVNIDHNPDIFKSSYVRVVRMTDGSYHMTDCPPNITPEERKAVFDHAYVIIDMVYDITSGF